MAVNKVIYGNNTIIDLTDSTVTPETLGEGVIAYNAKGERIVGKTGNIIPVRQYGNTPFRIIDNDQMPLTMTLPVYKSDGTSRNYNGCSPIMRCPRLLGINVYGDARVILYIGDLLDGKFVLDENYIFVTSSTGLYNFLNSAHNRIIETDGSKYFYYYVYTEGEYEIILGDEMPENGFEANAIVPFYSSNAGAFASSGNYSSLILPSGCYYVILPTKELTNSQRTLIHVSYHTKDSEALTVIPGGISFGCIPYDAGAAMLRIPDGISPDDLKVYASKPILSNANNGRSANIKKRAIALAKDFKFAAAKSIVWSDSARAMAVGKTFYGVPYSSRWRNSHYVGFEVSCETALNALADEYSIAYDGGRYYEGGNYANYAPVSGYSEIPSDGGPGYGLVCSAFMCLINGNPYPQSNRGFTFDNGFGIRKRTDLNSGMWLANEDLNHCVFVDEIYDEGYSLYHAISPCIGKTVQTSKTTSNAAINKDTLVSRLGDYVYSVSSLAKGGPNEQLLKLDVEVAGGNIRPWRGNKAVYGPWDKSANGSGIGITIHNGAATARLTTPSGTVHTLNVSGKVYLDIASYVTEDGTYTLDSGAGTIAEYFRYFNHDEVTLSFDSKGRAVLSSNNVNGVPEYVYAKVSGYGEGYKDVGSESGPIVIAAGRVYPDLAKDSSRVQDVYAAIVSDNTEGDCWGRYSCTCKMGGWELDDSDDYELPTASKTLKGGVKIGSGLEMDGEVLNVIPDTETSERVNQLFEKVADLEAFHYDWQSTTGTDIRIDSDGEKDAVLTADAPTEVTHLGKNMLEHPYDTEKVGGTSFTSNGLRCVKNEDGVLHVSGTTTSNFTYDFVGDAASKRRPIKKGTYTISGCPSGGSSTSWRLALTVTGIAQYLDIGEGITFTVGEDTTYALFFKINSGITVDFDIKPQLEMHHVKTEWEPYAKEIINYTGSDVDIILRNGVNHFSSDTPFTITQYVERNAESEKDMMNLKSLGAVGDGVTDDTAAINNALALAENKMLYVPEGTYIFAGTLHVHSGTTIIGCGEKSVFKLADTFGLNSITWRTGSSLNSENKYPMMLLEEDSVGCTLSNFALIGSTATWKDENQDGITVRGSNHILENLVIHDINYFKDKYSGKWTLHPGCGINIFKANLVSMRNCHVYDCGYSNIDIEDAETVTISDCKVGDACNPSAQILRYSKHIRFRDNTVYHTENIRNADVPALSISASIGMEADDIVVANNTFGGHVYTNSGGENNVKFIGNRIDGLMMTSTSTNYATGLMICNNHINGRINMRADNALVSNNIINNDTGNYMIRIYGNNVEMNGNLGIGSGKSTTTVPH